MMSRPSKVIVPLRTGSRPKIVLNTVDLPAPFGPITVVIAPRRTLRRGAVENRHLAVAGEDTIEDEAADLRAHTSLSVSEIGFDHDRDCGGYPAACPRR